MSWLSRFEAWVAPPAQPAAAFSSQPTAPDVTTPNASTWRAQSVARTVALRIPAMRRARAAILTPATFGLRAWAGEQLLAEDDARCAWLRQPEPNRTRFNTWALVIDDGIWHDKAVIRATSTIGGTTAYIERIHPQRWVAQYAANDPDTVAQWTVDGKSYTPAQFALAGFVPFDFASLGGLRLFGYELLQLYGDLQAAAGRYARAPHPHAILKNVSGDTLTDAEITQLLDDWDWARENRGTGYIDGYEYQTVGYSAKDLQLTEAREHAALEVARLLQLPAFAVDAKGGDSMTYGNIVDRRKDLVESLRPWTTVLAQTMSLDVRLDGQPPRGLLLPRGIRAEFDAAEYLREDANTRMGVWSQGLAANIFELDDVIAQEPLARKATA
jgi:hypothetical protein